MGENVRFKNTSCNLAGQLQNGKPAQNQKWPRNGRRNGRRPFFGRVPKWPKNGRVCRKSQNLSCPTICPAIFRPFWTPPEKRPPAISPAISRPLLVLGGFPFCSWPAKSQNTSVVESEGSRSPRTRKKKDLIQRDQKRDFLPLCGKRRKNDWQKVVNAHSSTPTPVFLTSREETQTMVRGKLRPKPKPPQTLYLPGKGETQTMV